MALGWKVLLPLALVIVFITATGIVLAETYGQYFMWLIPVLSVMAGLIAVAMIDRALRRKTYATS
jgi:hypothetical protein